MTRSPIAAAYHRGYWHGALSVPRWRRIVVAALVIAIAAFALGYALGRVEAASRSAQSVPAASSAGSTGQSGAPLGSHSVQSQPEGRAGEARGARCVDRAFTASCGFDSRPSGVPSPAPWHHDPEISFFGPGLYGRRTACGLALTTRLLGVAHRSLPCGALVEFRWRGRTLTVPVVDRGPWVAGRTWDLTGGACVALRHCWTGSIEWRTP